MWWIYWIYCHTLIDFRLCSGLSTATSVYFGAESSKLVSLRQWGSSDMKVRWRGSWWGLGSHESGEERGIAQVEKWKIGDKGRGGEERTVRWGGGGGEWSKVERAVSYVFVWKLWKAVCLSAQTETSPRVQKLFERSCDILQIFLIKRTWNGPRLLSFCSQFHPLT